MCRDRVAQDSFPITHEFMAQMLGVRRTTVTEAAQYLQEQGLIDYQRAMLSINDAAGRGCLRVLPDRTR